MNKVKKLVSLFLVIALLLSASLTLLVACNDDDDLTTQPTDTVKERDANLPTNVLHKVNVQETTNVFVDDSTGSPKTEYVVVYGNGDDSAKMASFVVLHVGKATNVEMASRQVTADDVYSAEQKVIYVNCPTQFAQAGLTMPTDDIGVTGYYIKSVDNSVFVATYGSYGTQHAAICLLQHLVGYDMYGNDAVVYKKSGSTMPKMDIVERPDFDFYAASNKMNDETDYGMGFQKFYEFFINIDRYSSFAPFHNALDYLPEDLYKQQHPDWYSTESFLEHGTTTRYDLCYTARGNQQEYQALVDTIYEEMMTYIYRNPTTPTITFTIEDHNSACQCNACRASAQKYNGSDAAAVIHLLNKVNDKIQAKLQFDAEQSGTQKRELNVLFFAYHKMLTPPAKQNADGSWSPIDETVVCGDRLGVYLAPIEANFGYSFLDDINAKIKDCCDGWGACTNLMYLWTYNTNFYQYMYPCNSFDSMIENYRYFKKLGAVYMWAQGQHNTNNFSAFSNFKDYVNSKALFDTSVSIKDLTDDYFDNYFLDASAPMRQYYDELVAHLTYLQTEYPLDFRTVIYAEVEKVDFWPMQLISQWEGYLNQAFQAIEKYKVTDLELYNKLYDRILLETMFIRYCQVTLHFGAYNDAQLRAMREQLKEDCEKYGFLQKSESTSIIDDFVKWGLM